MGQHFSKGPDAQAARVAVRQHGNVTHAQLRSCGLSDAAIRHRVVTGRLFRVHTGVYAVGRPPQTALERAAAAVLACGDGAALSHLGALALWGFATYWPRRFDVIASADRRPAGISVHLYRGLTRGDLRVHRGIRATSPARTLLDCAPRLDERRRRRVVNDALHSDLLSRAKLEDIRSRFPRHPGAKLLDPILAQRGITRSQMEDDFLVFCERHGLPRPLVNVRVGRDTVDALFPEHRLIVELDSWEFHGDRRAFETDRERDAEHLQHGLRTVRITWERLQERPEAEARRLRAIMDG